MDPTTPAGGPARFWVLALIAVLVTAGTVVGIVLYGSNDVSEGNAPDAAAQAADASGVGSTERESGTTGSEDAASGSADGATSLSTDDEAALAEVIDELSKATSAIRGLPFLEPVDTTFLSDAEFRARVLSQLDEDLESGELAEIEMIWQALGLIDADLSLEAAFRSVLEEAVLGFYDPETDELVMRGVVLDQFVRSTLVHELTHALDDQHFDLERVELMDGDDTEAQFAFVGLVEGTATWVEEQWVAQLDPGDQLDLRRAEAVFGAGVDYSGLPETLLIDVSLPYILGPELVRTITARGGTDGIDAAYLDPPFTGEHLFDPDAYLDGEGALAVAAPPTDGEIIAEGVVGSSGFYEMLLAFDPSRAGRIATDWGGDHYVVWRDDPDLDRACVRVDVVGDGADGTDRVEDALESYAKAHGDAVVERIGGRVRLTACG